MKLLLILAVVCLLSLPVIWADDDSGTSTVCREEMLRVLQPEAEEMFTSLLAALEARTTLWRGEFWCS